ncbi:MAG: hypothetical protein ACO1RX_15515 [Candidatus Sericytochromatia bacterium]
MYHTPSFMSMRYTKKIFHMGLGLFFCLTGYGFLTSMALAQGLQTELSYPQTPPIPLMPIQGVSKATLQPHFQLVSQDQWGHRRIQMYFQTAQKVQPPELWQLISRYQHRYDAVWLYFSYQAPTTLAPHWHTQAAWFQQKLPRALHQPGFTGVQQHQNLYWKYDK